MKNKFRISVVLFAAALLSAAFIVSCSKDDDTTPAVDLTALKASIAAAQTVYNASVEGKADGQYPTGSKAALQAAINAGQTVVDNSATTQAMADNAVVSVNLAVTTFQGLVNKPIAAENLVAHWSFDEGTGATAHDASDNHFDGTFKAGPVGKGWKGAVMPTWGADRTGAANKAIHFAGGNVEVPYNTKLNPTGAFTMSAWIKADTIKPGNRFLGLQSWIGYKFEVQEHNVPFFTLGWSETENPYDRDSGQELPVSEWHQVAVTFTPGHMIFYVDGTKIKEHTDVPNGGRSISGKPYNLTIGQDFPTDKYSAGDGTNFGVSSSPDYHVIPLAWGGYFQGSVDELRMYNIVLSETQIASLYTQEKP
ncbi:MAG: LamG domain-containing protein [Bacteroidota bacterium]